MKVSYEIKDSNGIIVSGLKSFDDGMKEFIKYVEKKERKEFIPVGSLKLVDRHGIILIEVK